MEIDMLKKQNCAMNKAVSVLPNESCAHTSTVFFTCQWIKRQFSASNPLVGRVFVGRTFPLTSGAIVSSVTLKPAVTSRKVLVPGGGLSRLSAQVDLGYVFRGMYAQQISWWLKFFKPSQLFIVNQDDIATRPGPVVSELLAFLGMPQNYTAITEAVSNKKGAFRGSYRSNSKMTLAARASIVRAVQRLKSFYAIHNANLYRLLDSIGVQGFSRFDPSRLRKQVQFTLWSLTSA
eukprot:scaffold38947_cov52-Prasinocladus_malaysianus.AAC.3